MRLGERLFNLLMGHRAAALALVFGLTAAVGAGAVRVRFDNSYRAFFVDGDPALEAYDDFVERFGSDEALVLAIATGGEPFSDGTLALIERLSEALGDLDGVRDVWSLTHMDAVVDDGEGLGVRRLIERVPPGEARARYVEGLVGASPLYRILLSADRRATVVHLTLERTLTSFEPKARLVREVRDTAARLAADREWHLAGGPVVDEASFRYSEEDAALYLPVMVACIGGMLAWLFRSVAATILPLLVVLLAIVWAYGFMGWVGWDANIVSSVLPPMLAAIGIADSVHLLQQLRLHARRGLGRRAALGAAFVHVLRPCLVTSLTTAAGMASLAAADLESMRELGLTAAVGVGAAFLLTIVALPALISALPTRWLGGLVRDRRALYPRWLVRMSDLAVRHSGAVLALSLAVSVAAVLGLRRIETGTSLLSYFFEDDPVYREALAVDRALGGALPLEVLVEAERGDLLEPDALARIDAMAAYVEGLGATGRAISGVDFLREARRAFLADPPEVQARPRSRAEAAQVLLLLEGEGDTHRYLSDTRLEARIEAPVAATRYDEVVRSLPAIEERLGELSGDDLRARVTGLARLMGAMEGYLLHSGVRSFGLAFLLVIGLIVVLFGSLRAGLLSIVPNLLPLLLTIGAMGWLGIRLDATTVMIAPVLLGIVVDDTVHLLERVLGARAGGAGVPQAFHSAVGEVGHAVVLTSVILAAGFLTPALGSFKPNVYFALLSALALALAVFADLVVFPAVACRLPWLVPGPRTALRGSRAPAS